MTANHVWRHQNVGFDHVPIHSEREVGRSGAFHSFDKMAAEWPDLRKKNLARPNVAKLQFN